MRAFVKRKGDPSGNAAVKKRGREPGTERLPSRAPLCTGKKGKEAAGPHKTVTGKGAARVFLVGRGEKKKEEN